MAAAWALSPAIVSAEAGRDEERMVPVMPRVTASEAAQTTRLRLLFATRAGAHGSDVEYCSA
jgi:hypothetical protein